MPFDDVAKQFVKPDVYSLEGLAAWLETQDGAVGYRFGDNADCLLCRYLKALGYRNVEMGGWGRGRATSPSGQHIDVAFRFEDSGSGPVVKSPHTYAAALDRCRALLAEDK